MHRPKFLLGSRAAIFNNEGQGDSNRQLALERETWPGLLLRMDSGALTTPSFPFEIPLSIQLRDHRHFSMEFRETRKWTMLLPAWNYELIG